MEHLREQWRKTASSGTYWRVHSKSRPFSLSDAFSVPMSSFGDRDKTNRQARPGYSCMANPWHLWVYCMAMGWLADGMVQDSDVIEFSGRPITKGDFTDLGVPESAIEWLWDGGRGVDREPLVMPDMRTVRKQSWSSFEKMLLGTPLPSGPQASDVRFNGDLDTWSDLAEILHERKGRYARESGPVIDFLIGKFILGGIGRMASIIPATTSTNGPFRTVVDVEQADRGHYIERLECGHTGKSGWRADWLGTTADGKTVKRRCYDCLTVEHKSWLNDRPGSEGHECSEACIIPIGQVRTASSVDAWREQPIEVMGRGFVLGDISGGKWFHGSTAVLSVGDRLVPGKTKNFKQSDPNSVSITSDLATAKYWASEVSKITGLPPHIYAVDPVGDVEVWKAGLAEMGTKVNVFEARVRSAVVLGVL